MGKVFVGMSMSLDGFIAGSNSSPDQALGDGGERLFSWYGSGDTAMPLPGTDMVFRISRASADLLTEVWGNIGAAVTGRRNFDVAHAWGGHPPGGSSYFVVTHTPPPEWVYDGSPFTFVTNGIESAIAQAKQAAGDKAVGVDGASIAQQAIQAGLVDELHIDLAHVLLGGGIRLFDNLGTTPIDLERIRVVEGQGVTHLHFRIVKSEEQPQ